LIFRNDYAAAERDLKAAVQVFARTYGEDHPRVLIPLEPLAEVYDRTNRPLARQEVLDRMQRIRAGSPHPAPSEKIYHLDKNSLMI